MFPGGKTTPGPGEVFETTIEKLVPGGDGLARLDGRVVFIPFTLPGEKVRARVTEAKKDFLRAIALEILEPSPDRAPPPCPVFGRCGGCDWQHIAPPAQLRQKLALAEDALRRVGGLAFPGLTIEGGEPWRYRNRVQIHRDASGTAGFLARASHDLVPIRDCPISRPAFGPLFAPAPAPGTGARPLETGARFPASRPFAGTRRFSAWSHPLPDGDFLISADPAAAGLCPTGEAAEIAAPLLGKTLRFDLRCFFQSNLEMTARLVPYALEGLSGRLALDLYCGVGLFGTFLADRFEQVLAVEENPAALEYARRNIGVTHGFLRGRVEELLQAERGPLAEAEPDTIVVDPPRTGLDRAVAGFLIAKRPARLVYVSCDPVTLARDLKSLLAAGFALEDLRLFDFYPQTAHVEAVAKLAWRGIF
ncbi:MAG: class I SAM-dependent RNA methyltransferase [Fibrobacteres bacterium]|nr:class I SAM-dependent RNA methyltransferase [Fibrobacterota bacterium]